MEAMGRLTGRVLPHPVACAFGWVLDRVDNTRGEVYSARSAWVVGFGVFRFLECEALGFRPDM
jgi:hypothetical protein